MPAAARQGMAHPVRLDRSRPISAAAPRGWTRGKPLRYPAALLTSLPLPAAASAAGRPERGPRVLKRPGRLRLALPALCVAAAIMLGSMPALAAGGASAGLIEKIDVEGNEFMSDDAVIALSDIQAGDRFDKDALQKEFMKVWGSGLFEDLRIEEAAGSAGGHVVIFVVREKPRVESVTYEQVKAITQSKIDEVLEQNDAQITANATLDQEKISKAKRILEEMLASEGYPDARATVVQRRVARSRASRSSSSWIPEPR